MSIKTKVKQIDIDGEKFYLTFNISSMHEYKERFGKSALDDLSSLKKELNEEVLFQLFIVCLRDEIGGDVLPKEFFDDINPMAVITEFMEDVIDVTMSSLPKPKPGQKKTKMKK